MEPIEAVVSSEVEDVGDEEPVVDVAEPAVMGVPVCEPPVVTVAVEEQLPVTHVSSSMPKQCLTPS